MLKGDNKFLAVRNPSKDEHVLGDKLNDDDWGYHVLFVWMFVGVPYRLLPDDWDYCCFV